MKDGVEKVRLKRAAGLKTLANEKTELFFWHGNGQYLYLT